MDRKPVMVVSHERSDTHFLMNSLAAAFGFVAKPYLNFDFEALNLNYHCPATILTFLQRNRDNKVRSLRKSHHQFAFFQPRIDDILQQVDFLYIYRDPRDVMHSFRHFLNHWPWFEGPKIDGAGAFIRTAPAGRMLRYQYHQLPDMLDRWRVHVEGWVDAAAQHPEILLVRYEDLDHDHDATLDAIAARKGWTRTGRRRPDLNVNTILKSQRESASNVYTADDLDYFRARIGPAMRRLGYDI